MLALLSAIASFLAMQGIFLVSVISLSGAVAVGIFLCKSLIDDFRETDGNFDTLGTVVFLFKLLSLASLAIALIIVLIHAVR